MSGTTDGGEYSGTCQIAGSSVEDDLKRLIAHTEGSVSNIPSSKEGVSYSTSARYELGTRS
jgi:hypothetical protein